MKQSASPETNRIDALQSKWSSRSNEYVNRYGPAVAQDREFIKANRDTYAAILKSTPYKDLSFDEKISYRIMRGQMRHLNRILYPNRIVRVVRALLVAAYRIGRGLLLTSLRVLNSLLAAMTNTQGIQFAGRRRPARNMSLLNPVRQNMTTNSPRGQRKAASQVPTRPQKVDTVAPRRRNTPRVVAMEGTTKGQRI